MTAYSPQTAQVGTISAVGNQIVVPFTYSGAGGTDQVIVPSGSTEAQIRAAITAKIDILNGAAGNADTLNTALTGQTISGSS